MCDRWREDLLSEALDKAKVPPCDLIVRGQGFKDGGEDLDAFRRSCLSGKVTPEVSLLLSVAQCGKRGRSLIRLAMKSYARQPRAGVGCGQGTMQRRLRSWRSLKVRGVAQCQRLGPILGSWRDVQIPQRYALGSTGAVDQG